jgi:hypothetical protein
MISWMPSACLYNCIKGVTNRMKKLKRPDDKVVISDEIISGKKEDKIFLCSWCNCALSRLIDHSGQNPSLYCSRCQMSFDLEYDNLRHESKITVPDRNEEPCITSIQTDLSEDIAIRKTPGMRGGFAQLARKGTIKFTSYSRTEKE